MIIEVIYNFLLPEIDDAREHISYYEELIPAGQGRGVGALGRYPLPVATKAAHLLRLTRMGQPHPKK